MYGETISGTSAQLKKLGYRVDEVGKQFGVLKVSSKEDGALIDVSVPREENKTGIGHRDFEVSMSETMTPTDAVQRRDFTFNAIMYDHANKTLIDPTGGLTDLEEKTLRHISEKFSEDPLRVLRGFQFAARFGLSYNKETASLCQSIRGEYPSLSTERVREEWAKFFEKGVHPKEGIKALQDSGWDDIVPGLREALQDSGVGESLSRMSGLSERDRRIFGASVVFSRMFEKDGQEFLKIGSVCEKERKKIRALVATSSADVKTPYGRRKTSLYLSGAELTLRDLSGFAKVNGDREKADLIMREGGSLLDGPEKDLIDGNDVLSLRPAERPGRWVKDALDFVRERQYQKGDMSKSEALDAAKEFLA